MNHIPFSDRRNLRTVVAGFLTYVLLTSQMAPMAMALSGSANRGALSRVERKESLNAPAEQRSASSFAPVPVPLRVTAAGMAPIITATKVDSFPDLDMDGKVSPGQTITYNVTLTNTGPDPALNLTLNDTVDANTTLVPGSAVATPIAFADAYNVIGNVRIQPNAAQGLLANDINPNTGNNMGLTASGGTTSTQGGDVVINADGSFSYDPQVGFTGTDTFTYTATSANGVDTRTVTLTVAGMIFFVNDDDPVAGGDGRLTNPFNCLVGAGCFSASTDAEAGDNIFLLNGAYTGGLTFLANQKLIGQGATDTLANIAGVGTVEPYSDPLPVTNGIPANVTITTAAAATNALTVNAGGIVLRGFTVANTTGAKIFGSGFGTLTAGNNTSPDLVLNGAGQALSLTTGTFAATSAFLSVATTSSGSQGISLSGVAGTVSFGSTTVSGATTQGILVGTTTANINFGNTSVTGGTDGISLQNNSSGTRTFGTLSVSSNSGVGFLHAVGGGTTTVTGATTITNPTGVGIDVDGSNANLSFAGTTVDKGTTSNIGVDLTNNATRTIGFTSLTVTTTNAFALNTNNSGTVNASGGLLTQSGAGGGAASLTNTTLGLTFSSISSNNGGNGIIISGGSGTLASATTNLQNNAGIGLLMSSSAVAANFGNTTVNSSAGDGVDLSGNTGAITFADLDITPDANLRGLDASNNTGTISSTSGDIATTGAPAINISGPAGRTPLSMTLTNVDSTNSTTLGVDLNLVSGNLTVNDPGVATNITNPTGIGIQVRNTASGTINFGNTNVNGSGGTGVVLGTASNGNAGAITFADLDITPDNAQRGLHSQVSTGTITATSGTIATTNPSAGSNAIAIEIVGTSAGSRTPINLTFNSVSANNALNGIVLTNTSDGGNAFRTLGTGSTDGSGGIISNITNRGASFISADDIALNNMTFTNVGTVNGADPTISTSACGDIGLGTNLSCNGGIHLESVTGATLTNVDMNGGSQVGINGSSVTNFTLTNSNVLNFGDQVREDGVKFFNMLGTSSITNTIFDANEAVNVNIQNGSGTLTSLTFTGNTVSNINAPNGSHGLVFNAFGTATMKIVANNNTFTDIFSNCMNMFNTGTGILESTIQTNRFDMGTVRGCGASAINVAQQTTGTVRFNISNNGTLASPTFIGGNSSHAININQAGDPGADNGIIEGQIVNNFIGNSSSPTSSTVGGSGINVLSISKGTLTVLIQGNTVQGVGANGINVQMSEEANASHRVNATILNNIATVSDVNSFDAIRVVAGALSTPAPGDAGILCGEINNNDGSATAAGNDFTVRQRFATTFQLRGYTGGSTDTAAVQTFLDVSQANDPLGAGNDWFITTQAPGGGFVNTPGGAQCTQPVLPTAPETFIEKVGADTTAPGDMGSTGAPASQTVALANPESITSRPFISSPQRRFLAAAAEIIPANGTASAELNSLDLGTRSKRDGGAAFRYAAASTSAPLAQTQTRGSQDKQTKGGGGKPATPSTTGSTPQQTGGPAKPAVQSPTPGVVVDPGLRYIPKPRPVTPPVGDGNPPIIVGNNLLWNVGTLPAGQSVTITFQVTVNTPPPTFTQVSNQGTVTADGGISVLTDDPAVGGMNDPTITGVTVPPDLSLSDASVAEPASGSTPMIFTLALSTPAPAGGIAVTLSTEDVTATGGTCAADDYTTVTGGTVTFAAGEQIKTFPVTVCSDATSEGDETFSLDVDSAPGANIADGQGTGTITANVPGTTLISEMRTTGENGAGDSFVEIYNNTDTPHTVPAGGYGLFKRGADCDEVPVLIGTIPATTVIQARGHYLFTGSSYSLVAYAAGDAMLTTDIESDFNVGLFSTVDPLAISTANRLDAVGFIGSAGGICDLLREGTALPQALGSTAQYSFVREFTLVSNDVPTPTDGNDNAADFTVVSTTPATPVGSHATPKLGAPGPENLTGPNLKKFSQVGAYLLDQTQSASGSRNRVRDTSPVPNGALGTLSIRRRFTNTTGASITRLRFLIYDITTGPPPPGTADLRAMSSVNVAIAGVMDPATCAPAMPPCTVMAQGTTLETPPAQPNGGGLNSSMAAGTVTMGTPLADGASISLQFLFGLQQTGSFRVFVFVEALP